MMSQTDDDSVNATKKRLYDRIDLLDTKINQLVDNGVFTPQGTEDKLIDEQRAPSMDSIQEQLLKARKSLDNSQFSECETYLALARALVSRAIYSKTPFWRFLNIHAGHIWIYLIGILVAIAAIYFIGIIDCGNQISSYVTLSSNSSSNLNSTLKGQASSVPITTSSNSSLPTVGTMCFFNSKLSFNAAGVYAVTWGCIGAILRGLWYLKDSVDERTYSNSWTIYFLSAPFLGGILGAIVYFIIIGGLLTVTREVQINNVIPIIALAALAGFNWEWAVKIFYKIGDALSPSSEQKVS